jgi:hypothetical protein
VSGQWDLYTELRLASLLEVTAGWVPLAVPVACMMAWGWAALEELHAISSVRAHAILVLAVTMIAAFARSQVVRQVNAPGEVRRTANPCSSRRKGSFLAERRRRKALVRKGHR